MFLFSSYFFVINQLIDQAGLIPNQSLSYSSHRNNLFISSLSLFLLLISLRSIVFQKISDPLAANIFATRLRFFFLSLSLFSDTTSPFIEKDRRIKRGLRNEKCSRGSKTKSFEIRAYFSLFSQKYVIERNE